MYGTELSKFHSKFQSNVPPPRFLTLICLCSDGDHRSKQDGANGNAANLHKVTSAVKNAATQCDEFLRDVLDTQCRPMGKEVERKFETADVVRKGDVETTSSMSQLPVPQVAFVEKSKAGGEKSKQCQQKDDVAGAAKNKWG